MASVLSVDCAQSPTRRTVKPNRAVPCCRRSPSAAVRHHHHHRRRRWWWPMAGHPEARAAASTAGRVVLYDLYDQLVPYEQAWRWQKQLVEVVHELNTGPGTSNSSNDRASGDVVGAALLLQHPPVYTLGAGSTERHLKFDAADPPLPLYRTERGGEVTYHGPGQLVLYPILSLHRLQPDLHWYLRSLEEVVIRALAEVSGLEGGRVPGLTGVWVDGRKVAAIGVRATRWVTYHGLALNVTTDLAPFSQIVPCGIADRPVASVQELVLPGARQDVAPLGRAGQQQEAGQPPRQDQQRRQQQQQQHGGDAALLLEEYRHGLLSAFEEVFGLQVEALVGAGAVQQLEGLGPPGRAPAAAPATAAKAGEALALGPGVG